MSKNKKQPIKEIKVSKPPKFSQPKIIPAPADKRSRWMIIFLVLTSIFFYANTYNDEYALDDAMAITLNSITLKGFDGIKEHLTSDFLYGFRHQKSKDAASAR